MGGFQDFLILFSFLVEVAVLFYLERKAWHTIYTPLNFLMLPYLFVLLITIAVSGSFGLVGFYYPSILIWSVGLLLFAIPSLAFASYSQKKPALSSFSLSPFDDDNLPPYLVYLGILLVLLFAYRLRQTIGSSEYFIGSDDFAEDFATFGFWGHLSRLCDVLLMLFIYYLSKERRWLWFLIIALVGVMVIRMVKGHMIIPCVVGVIMRLVSGKMRISGRFLTILLISAVAVFYLTYLLAYGIADGKEVTDDILLFIFRHFVHYFTSGTLGFSLDMQVGLPDYGSVGIILSPFINILNHFTGNEEILSPVNPVFLYTGFNYTNVRTMFGTLFVHTTYMQFAAYVLCLSSICYLLKMFGTKYRSVLSNLVYYYFCTLLAMGWFEFYFFHLDVLEIPAIILILKFIDVAMSVNRRSFAESVV